MSAARKAIPFTLPFQHYDKLGYKPIPLKPNSKEPLALKGWNTIDYDYEALDREGGYGMGLLCNNVVGLDIDVDNPQHAQRLQAAIRKVLKLPANTPLRIGRAPKRLLILRCEEPLPGFDVQRTDAKVVLFQLLGRGKQFVIQGTHPDTKQPYTISRALPERSKLPLLTAAQVGPLRDAVMATLHDCGYDLRATGGAGKQGTGKWAGPRWDAYNVGQAEQALAGLDPDMSMNEWAQVGIALHDGTHGDAEGLALWDAWSAPSEKYMGGKDCADRWRGFKAGGAVTRATLFKNDFPKRAVEPQRALVLDEPAAPGFFTTTHALLAQPTEQRRQFIDDLLQVGCTLLHGPGKKGKSWFLLDAMDHVTSGKPFMGRVVTPAKVLYVGAEDNTRRFQSRLRIMDIAPSEQLVLMHREQLKAWGQHYQPHDQDDNKMPWTPELLITTMRRQTGADAIVLDTQEVVEMELAIEHGDRNTSLTRQHYRSTSSYDEVAQRLGIAIVLVAHWGAIKSLPLAVTNPHEMINTTKTKIAGALTSVAMGPLANQELDDDSGMFQLSVLGKDITTGNRYEAVQRDPTTQRHSSVGAARDVVLRDTLAELMVALEGLLIEKGPGSRATSSELAAALGINRGDTVRKKIAVIEKHARQQATQRGIGDGRVYWKGQRLRSASNGYWLE